MPGVIPVLALKVPRPRKALSPGQTEMVGHAITWPHSRLQVEGLEMTRSSGPPGGGLGAGWPRIQWSIVPSAPVWTSDKAARLLPEGDC